jgi:hypothetical protein
MNIYNQPLENVTLHVQWDTTETTIPLNVNHVTKPVDLVTVLTPTNVTLVTFQDTSTSTSVSKPVSTECTHKTIVTVNQITIADVADSVTFLVKLVTEMKTPNVTIVLKVTSDNQTPILPVWPPAHMDTTKILNLECASNVTILVSPVPLVETMDLVPLVMNHTVSITDIVWNHAQVDSTMITKSVTLVTLLVPNVTDLTITNVLSVQAEPT